MFGSTTQQRGAQPKVRRRDEAGATTAEYAVCTGAAVGFAGLLFKLLTSGAGEHLLSTVLDHVVALLPF